jgi:FKBP-type peptidyl-prolyl cis-trans isomerase FklB
LKNKLPVRADRKELKEMRLLCITALIIAFFVSQVAAETVSLKSEKGKRSYSIGNDIGNNLKKQPFEVDADLLARGLKDALTGKKTAMTDQEMKDVLTALQKELMAKRVSQIKEISDKNKKDGEAFLAENKKKPGIITLPDGLQYKIIQEGTGKIPVLTDKVKVNYKGSIIDGTEFDSSYKRGEPLVYDIAKFIPGWKEALTLMKVGSKWEIYVPSELAYGEPGSGQVIGPNSVLIFEMELISIEK